MLSRSGCCIKQNVAHPDQQLPTPAFSLLEDPSERNAARLRSFSKCRRDARFEDFVEKHGGDLTCDAALAELEAQAWLSHNIIGLLESRNSSIRRWVLMRSLQSNALDSKDLSAEWTM